MVDVLQLLAQTKLETRPYQRCIISRALECYTPVEEGGRGLRSVMIESATGSGKTCMALAIIKGLQDKYPDLAACWVCMRRNLLGQAEAENINKGINANVTFLSMFSKELPKQFLEAKRRIMILDEGQHDSCNTMAHLHAKAEADYIMLMSATPFRSDHVKICVDTIIKDSGIGPLIRDGWLSQYEHYTIKDWTLKTVCDTFLREPHRWGKSIIYNHTIDQCNNMMAVLQAGGIACEVVTASTDRSRQIDDLRTGKLQALINCMVLTEGMDVPQLQTVFCRPSCKGVTIQMCGRVFRKHPDLQFKKVVQCEKTKWPFMRTAEPIMSYKWDNDRWLSLKMNKKIDAIACNMLTTLASIDVKLPTFLLRQEMKARGRSRRRGIPGA